MTLARSTRPWLRPLLLLVLIGELLAASAVLRSDLFVREPLDNALADLGARLGGTFEVGRLAPHGLTGLTISELRFVPADDALPAVTMRDLVVLPRVDRLLVGDVAVEHVAVGHLESTLRTEQVDSIRSLLERLRDRDAGQAHEGARGGLLPDAIRISRADVSVVDARLRHGHGLLRLRDVGIERAAGRPAAPWTLAASLAFDAGLPGRLEASSTGGRTSVAVSFETPTNLLSLVEPAAVGLPATASLRVEALALERGELLARGLTVEGAGRDLTGLDGWQLDGFDGAELRVRRTAGELTLTLRDGRVHLASPTGRAAIPLRRGELWRVDGASGKVTARLGHPDGGFVDLAAMPGLEAGVWIVSADAHGYDVSDWAGLLSSEAPVRVVEGRFSGTASAIVETATGRVDLSLDGTLEQGRASAPFLAARPLESITAGLGGEVRFDPVTRTLRWSEGRLLLEGLPLHFEADLLYGEVAPRLVLTARVDDVPAEPLRRALPAGLAPALDDVTLAGTLSAEVRADLDTARPDEAVLDLSLDSSRLEVVAFASAVPIDRLDGDVVLAISTPDGVGRTVGPGLPGWVRYEDVDDRLIPALISAEDGRFFSHDGFDWRAIEASVELNLRERRIVRGGSTISQQVARSLFLGHERTLGRKFEEAFLTWQLEQLVPKRRIMELYVNAVHWGPGIYGISEAAASYFGRLPGDLAIGEAVFLASILPNPNYFGTQYARHIVTPSRREKICNILRNMELGGVISEREATRTCRAAQQGVVSAVPPPEWLVEPPAPLDGNDVPVAVVLGGVTLTAMR